MGYDGRLGHHRPDSAARRRSGLIGRFGHVDPTDGGEIASLQPVGRRVVPRRRSRAGGDGLRHRLPARPVLELHLLPRRPDNGDQFEQYDSRRVYGGHFEYDLPASVERPGRRAARRRRVPPGRHSTRCPVSDSRPASGSTRFAGTTCARRSTRPMSPMTSAGPTGCAPRAGLRFDYLDFSVDSDLPANSGDETDSIVGPKLDGRAGPLGETEFFLNAGAASTPTTHEARRFASTRPTGRRPSNPSIRSCRAIGYEVGFRTAAVPKAQFSAALWNLDIDSELLFVGDGGITEPSRATRRYGVELGAYWTPLEAVDRGCRLFVVTCAVRPRSTLLATTSPVPSRRVVSVGLSDNQRETGWFGGARWRYFGPGPAHRGQQRALIIRPRPSMRRPAIASRRV